MKPIQVLSPLLANQIAAGEVVERPVSIVKELIENSLDAGATKIDVSLLQGGLSFIQVQDDGCGILKQELALSLTRHATSKIESPDDLMAIGTLGFRGEALASIISVAKCELSSKPKQQAQAWSVAVKGTELKPYLYPASKRDGTTVCVRDLFYNVPARRKFLKSVRTEFNHIEHAFKSAALAHPEVSFSLTHNEKGHRQYASTTQSNRLQQVLGKRFLEQSYFLEYQTGSYRIHGWMTSPPGFKKSTDSQFFYINGRVIRDKVILHAIKQSLDSIGIVPLGAYPGYVLYLNCPPQEIDVNVHPTKHEIRFSDPSFVHDFIQKALRLTFDQNSENSDAQSNLSLPAPKQTYSPSVSVKPPLDLPNLNLNLEIFKPKASNHSVFFEHFLFCFNPTLKITNLKRDKNLIWEAFFQWSLSHHVPRRICLFPRNLKACSALVSLNPLGFTIKQNIKGDWQLVEVPSFVNEESLELVIGAIEQNEDNALLAVKTLLKQQSWTLFKQDKVFQTLLELGDFDFQQTITSDRLEALLEPIEQV